jgi:hypothetical protein
MEIVQMSKLTAFVQVLQITQLNVVGRPHVVANKNSRSQLGKLAEQCDIPWGELNKIAKEVVGREFGDCSRLSELENMKVRKYLKKNMAVLGERYRRMKWSKLG